MDAESIFAAGPGTDVMLLKEKCLNGIIIIIISWLRAPMACQKDSTQEKCILRKTFGYHA